MKGVTELEGVEFINMGQKDTEYGGFDVKYTFIGEERLSITSDIVKDKLEKKSS